MRVVLAPDKFKGCLTAGEVADALSAGLVRGRPGVETIKLPVADGGDGTVAAALTSGFTKIVVDAVGPTGKPIRAPYALDGNRAVVELAAVVGLDLLPDARPDPLGSSTYGLGLVMADAVARGAELIVLGLGGSASTDGGAGMVQALGVRLLDADGHELGRGGGALTRLARIDLTGLARLSAVTIMVASDVDNPLLGPAGAAAVFGPQKGATPADIVALEQGLSTWARIVGAATGSDLADTPGAGAAGGTAYAALAVLDADLTPGIELILSLIGFENRLAGVDLVITGEGSLDEQSLAGKAPVGVARAAARAGVPVVAVAGRTRLSRARLAEAGIAAAYPLSDLEPDPVRSIADAPRLLAQVGARIAEEWLS
jgi:glycerate 2-kinase